jgi:hypothetical protein
MPKHVSQPNCPYKNLFGNPNEGLHAYRFANIAIVDVIFTIMLAYILSGIFAISFWKILGSLFFLGIVMHRQLCVRTTIDKWLFPDA